MFQFCDILVISMALNTMPIHNVSRVRLFMTWDGVGLMDIIIIISILYIITLRFVKPTFVEVDLKVIRFVFRHNKKK